MARCTTASTAVSAWGLLANRKRKGQHPLPDRRLGKHVIDQVGGRLHHAARATTGAKSPALTTESHQVLVPAAIALHAQEAVFEQPTLQIVFELLANEPRHMTAGALDLLHEARIMFRNDGI